MSETKQRICFVIPSLSSGGAERVVSVLASQLARDGHEVSVITYFRTQNDYPVDPRVRIACISNGPEAAYRSLAFGEKIGKIREALKQIRPRYLIPFLPHTAIHAALAGMGLKLKMIQTVRAAPAIVPASFFQRKIRDCLVAFSCATFVQTDSQKAYFPRWMQRRITVLPNPVSESMLSAVCDRPSVLTKIISAGRLTGQKNFELLIEAVKLVREKGYEIQLSIYGEGELRSLLQQRIDDLGCSDCCHLRGRTDDMAKALCKSHLFVLPSHYEGMPNALMEAMAVGLPCISTDCPTGPRELIEPGRGLLVPVNDPSAMANAIEQMILHPDEAAKLGAAARNYIRNHYSPQIIARRLIDEVVPGKE